MGFIEYARSQSFEKDILKQRIIIDKYLKYPKIELNIDGISLFIPQPEIHEKKLSFLGYIYQNNNQSKVEIVRIFKSMVTHLSTHTVVSNFSDFNHWKKDKNVLLSKFIPSLVEDLIVKNYIKVWYPDRLKDLSYDFAIALFRMRNLETINTLSTRLMASLLIYVNIGLKMMLTQDRDILLQLFHDIDDYKTLIEEAIFDENLNISQEKVKLADAIYFYLINNGPIIEVPSFPFTEYHGANVLFPDLSIPISLNINNITQICLTNLGGSSKEQFSSSVSKLTESEALQVFESHIIDQVKEESIIKKYEGYTILSRFKRVVFPNQDQNKFLRVKNHSKKETNKLIGILNSVSDSEMEDNRKMYGVLDLSDVIQVISNKSDRTDVFLHDEIIEKNYAWAIVIDTSKSMFHVRDYALENIITLTEAANMVLLDQNCWGIFAFNEKLQIIKDFNESYNTRVKSRIGGLVFEGATYLPDAIEVIGGILRKRPEDSKIMFVLTDCQPFGYSNILSTLSEVVDQMQRGKIVIMGIGIQSNNVEYIFENYVPSYNLKDCVSDLGNLYIAKLYE